MGELENLGGERPCLRAEPTVDSSPVYLEMKSLSASAGTRPREQVRTSWEGGKGASWPPGSLGALSAGSGC